MPSRLEQQRSERRRAEQEARRATARRAEAAEARRAQERRTAAIAARREDAAAARRVQEARAAAISARRDVMAAASRVDAVRAAAVAARRDDAAAARRAEDARAAALDARRDAVAAASRAEELRTTAVTARREHRAATGRAEALRTTAVTARRDDAAAARRAEDARAAALNARREHRAATGRAEALRTTAVTARRDHAAATRRAETLRATALGAAPPRPQAAPPPPLAPLPKRPPTVEEFVDLGIIGPADELGAPDEILLPGALFDEADDALEKAFEDGLEHGGVFGHAGRRRTRFAVAKADGEVHRIDFTKAREKFPGLRPSGVFHTHLYETIDTGDPNDPRWAGGGHSDGDIVNFLTRKEHMSMVVAQTRTGQTKLYLLLRPRTLTLRTSPGAFAAAYKQRVLKLVAAGKDPIDASEQVLTEVSHEAGLAFYTSVGDPLLERR